MNIYDKNKSILHVKLSLLFVIENKLNKLSSFFFFL